MNGRRAVADRHGFTLIEVAVWVAVLAILATALTPALLGVIDAERRGGAITELQQIDAGVQDFDMDVVAYPASMTQMLQGIVTGEQDLCGNNFGGNDVRKWEGPYTHIVPGPDGYALPIGFVAPAFAYQVMGGTPYLRITVNQVLEEDAIAMDAREDAGDGSAAGTYRWGAPDADGFVVLTYNIVVPTC